MAIWTAMAMGTPPQSTLPISSPATTTKLWSAAIPP